MINDTKSLLRFWPLMLFGGLMVLFAFGLRLGDPSVLPGSMQNKPVPSFTLPPLAGSGIGGFATKDLQQTRPLLLNVWASWCVPCRLEHPLLMQLADKGVLVYGLNYKDNGDAARRFLGQLGNPYHRIGADSMGRVAIDFGVYGVPETFVIHKGIILYRYAGPLTPQIIADNILPHLNL